MDGVIVSLSFITLVIGSGVDGCLDKTEQSLGQKKKKNDKDGVVKWLV